MYAIEVRRRDSNELLARAGTEPNTGLALKKATALLSACGGCFLSAQNRRQASGRPYIVVAAAAFPFTVSILNTCLVDGEGTPLADGGGIGPFPVKSNSAAV